MSHATDDAAAISAAEYAALTSGAGLVDLNDSTLVEISGDDRAAFLHNLCTNEIRKLPAGAGCEAFLLNVQGKILFYVLVFSGSDSLVLQTSPGHGERLVAHLDRYLIREKVTLADRSAESAELLLAGQTAAELLGKLGASELPTARLQSVKARLQAPNIPGATDVSPVPINSGATGVPPVPINSGATGVSPVPFDVWLRRVDITGGPGFLIDCQRIDRERLRLLLIQTGAVSCSQQTFDAKRIEAGFPVYGRDITDKNLPQEVDRDALAISFVKGCYLGQETVARIDALGHVNRVLRGVRFSGPQAPAADTELRSGSQVVGQVTSSTFSPRLGSPLALAYLRRGHEQPGAKLESDFGFAEVIALPLAN